MTLSIVILNYRTRGLLRHCLRGLLAEGPEVPFEVIVVDNDSRDGSIEMVRAEFPTVRLVSLPRNLGYSRGNNAGLRIAVGTYLLVMNSDIVVTRGQLDELCRYLDVHPRVGAVGPHLRNPDGTTQESAYRFYRFLTPLYHRTVLGRTRRGRRELARFTYADWDHRSSRPVCWLMSSCLLLRRTALDASGTFDERFFLYLADTDLCRRLWLAGWEVHYQPAASLVHYHRRQSAEDWRTALTHLADWLRYLRKWRGQPPPTGS
jgi:hypothetical protein